MNLFRANYETSIVRIKDKLINNEYFDKPQWYDEMIWFLSNIKPKKIAGKNQDTQIQNKSKSNISEISVDKFKELCEEHAFHLSLP